MSNRFAFAALAASFALTACGSTGASETRAQAPVQPSEELGHVEMTDGASMDEPAREPWAPAPWTNAFSQSAVMLANTFRIEGPVGLLEHVVASSDDAFYERSMETTPDGLLQVIRRVSPDVPEIRVQLDAWTLAAFDRVTILERVDCSPVTVIASGDALWRDSNGRIAKGQRLECGSEIGVDIPAAPAGAIETVADSVPASSVPEADVLEDVDASATSPESVPSPVATDEPEGASSSEVQ